MCHKIFRKKIIKLFFSARKLKKKNDEDEEEIYRNGIQLGHKEIRKDENEAGFEKQLHEARARLPSDIETIQVESSFPGRGFEEGNNHFIVKSHQDSDSDDSLPRNFENRKNNEIENWHGIDPTRRIKKNKKVKNGNSKEKLVRQDRTEKTPTTKCSSLSGLENQMKKSVSPKRSLDNGKVRHTQSFRGGREAYSAEEKQNMENRLKGRRSSCYSNQSILSQTADAGKDTGKYHSEKRVSVGSVRRSRRPSMLNPLDCDSFNPTLYSPN